MKKRPMLKRVALISLAAFFFTGSASAAPDRIGRYEVGAAVGGAFPGNSIDSASYVQLNLGRGLTQHVGVGIQGGWYEADANPANKEVIGTGMVLADVVVRNTDWHESLVPYAVLGLGYAGSYMSNEGTGRNQGQDDWDGNFAFKLGAGLEWFFSDQWATYFDLAYVYTGAKMARASANPDNFWTTAVGAKYVF